MFIKNWMLANQYSISSNALATEAILLLREHNLRMLPVVDDGRLRGLLLRRDLSEAAQCVTGSGDICEMNYFCNKLKVKDLMIRNPVTISVNDTVEQTLVKGKETTMSNFPVMDGDEVVGLVSDREIFVTLFKILEAGNKERTRITLADVTLKEGTLSEILSIVDAQQATARAIFTVAEDKSDKVRVVVRYESEDPGLVFRALEDRGYTILEMTS
ncbi:MAG: CBS domain-containing protein [Thermodesulfobacteriota bacterium]